MKSRQKHPPPAQSRRAAPSPRAAADVRRGRSVLAGALLVAITCAAYVPLWNADFIEYDDEHYVTANRALRSTAGLWHMWFTPQSLPQYYPVVHSTFWLEYHAWGLAPRGYHVVNVLLHAASAVLAWRLLARLRVPGAWLAAAIFAVHPVAVESVAWVSERKNVLSLALALSSMLCYLRFAPPEPAEDAALRRSARRLYYALAFGLFAAALLSKTVVAPLPAVLLVVYWWKRGRVAARDVAPLVPFFALAVSLGLMTVWLEKHHVGAEGADWSLSVVERCLVAGRVPWFYAGKIAWPYPLSFFYPRFSIDAHVWWQYLCPLAAVATMVALWLARKRIGRGPLAAVLIFAAGLLPASGFFNVWPFRYSFVADHYQYHACLALIALAVAGAALAVARLGPPARKAVFVGAMLLVATLAVVTFRQARVYGNLELLTRDVIAKYPRSWIGHLTLAGHLMAHDRTPEALAEFRRAVELNPDAPDALAGLGLALVDLGRPLEAAPLLARALDIFPTYKRALYGMGAAQLSLGNRDEAAHYFAKALEHHPDYPEAEHGLGLVRLSQGRLDEAVAHLAAAVRLDPDFAMAHDALGDALARQGQSRAAAEQYLLAARLSPTPADDLNKLGLTMLDLGQTTQAIGYFQQALKARPDHASARENLEKALLLEAKGRSNP